MKMLVLTGAALLCGVGAVGCASRTTQAGPTEFPSYDVRAARTHQALRTMRTMPARTPAPAPAPTAVTLTGDKTYVERFDPSGWSGTSTPPAGTGGGPIDDDNPYEDGDDSSSPSE